MEVTATQKQHLAALVDELLKGILKTPVQEHAAYAQRRQRFYQVATIASIVDRNEAGILEAWGGLQNQYAAHVREALAKKKEELRSVDIEVLKAEIADLEPLERERNALWEEMHKSRTAPDPQNQKSTRFAALQEKLKPLNDLRSKYGALSNALEQVTRVHTDLDAVLKMPLQEKINVVLPDPEQVLADLEKGMYTGMKVEPYNQFAPEQAAAVTLLPVVPVNPNSKPKELLALLGLKAVVDRYAPNVSFTAVAVSPEIPAGMEHRIVGTYLKTAPAIFGVEKVQGNTFKKMPHSPLEEGEFIARILDHLRREDNVEVNRFYLTRALQRIREDPRMSYTPFTVEEVLEAVKPDHFPMTAKAVAVNLGRYSDKFGVTFTQEGRSRHFEFTEVIVTNEHQTRIKEFIPQMGHRPFGIVDLGRKISESGTGYIHPRVVETALERPGPYGLRKNRDGTYESLTRPATATTSLAQAREDADVSDLV